MYSISEIDWSKSSTMMPLYALFLGTSLNKQEPANKKEPACVRIRLKILPCLCFSKSEESVIWPQCMQVCTRLNLINVIKLPLKLKSDHINNIDFVIIVS